jgi:hypothetical protein
MKPERLVQEPFTAKRMLLSVQDYADGLSKCWNDVQFEREVGEGFGLLMRFTNAQMPSPKLHSSLIKGSKNQRNRNSQSINHISAIKQ